MLYEKNTYDPTEDYVKDVLVLIKVMRQYRSVTVKNGKWPVTSYDKRGNYTIKLPFKKKGEAYYTKLKMFAAHEMGHVLYTWDNHFEDRIIGMDKLESTIHNYLEDIRIEGAMELYLPEDVKRLLPYPFIDLRHLLHYQLGKNTDNVFSLAMYKAQWYLMGVEFDAGEDVNKLFEEKIEQPLDRFYQMLLSGRYNEDSTLLVLIDLVKYLADLFREECPEDAEEGSKKQEGGDPTDEDDISSDPLSLEIEDGDDSPLMDVDSIIMSVIDSSIKPVTYVDLALEAEYKAREVTTKVSRVYASSIEQFKRLFTGGWRAPKRSYKREREYGELDCNFLYKAKFKGQERTLYQQTKVSPLPGVSVLCMLDISSSMAKYLDRVIDTSIILNQSNSHDVKMRIVLFTDNLIILKDFDSKFTLTNYTQTKDIMASTPTGEALDLEYKNLITRSGDKLLVVVTDGQPNNLEHTKAQLYRYKKSGVQILYIQFGESYNHFYEVVDYSITAVNIAHLPQVLSTELHKVLHTYALQKIQTGVR